MLALIHGIINLPQASTMAAPIDWLYDFVFWLSVISFVIVMGMVAIFMWKYRRRTENDITPYIEGHTPTEVVMSVVLFVICMLIFYWGWEDFAHIRTMPSNAMEVNVTGKQWEWKVAYQNGRVIGGKGAEFIFPKGQKVKLIMTSEDVLHSFFVPAFRLKQDVIPHQYTALWFEGTQEGTYDVECAEYCAGEHSKMLAKVTIVSQDAYDQWQRSWEMESVRTAMANGGNAAHAHDVAAVGDAPAASSALAPATSVEAKSAAAAIPTGLAAKGKQLYSDKICSSCHSIDGTKMTGPSFKGLWGANVELEGGAKATVDENYVRESITTPNAKVVQGFAPIMPTFQGQLSSEDITALIEFIKTLK